jgi:hypothetical protein
MLTANVCLTGFIFGSVTIGMTGFTLHNDLKQIQYEKTRFVLLLVI